MRRFGTVFVLAALLALAVGLGTAGADPSPYATQVTVDDGGPDGASGHVSSKTPKCLRGRRVDLFIVDPITGGLIKIGTATTNAEGEWEIDEDLFAGDYVAEVDPKPVKVGKKRHSCRGDRSPRKHL